MIASLNFIFIFNSTHRSESKSTGFLNDALHIVTEIKMPIDFYQLPGSAPCRAVALTAAALGIEMNFKEVNLMNGDNLKPEYLKVRVINI